MWNEWYNWHQFCQVRSIVVESRECIRGPMRKARWKSALHDHCTAPLQRNAVEISTVSHIQLFAFCIFFCKWIMINPNRWSTGCVGAHITFVNGLYSGHLNTDQPDLHRHRLPQVALVVTWYISNAYKGVLDFFFVFHGSDDSQVVPYSRGWSAITRGHLKLLFSQIVGFPSDRTMSIHTDGIPATFLGVHVTAKSWEDVMAAIDDLESLFQHCEWHGSLAE